MSASVEPAETIDVFHRSFRACADPREIPLALRLQCRTA